MIDDNASDAAALRSLRRRTALAQAILCPEARPAGWERIRRYFGPSRFPGTASIGDRKTCPEIFQDTLGSRFETYEDWRDRILEETLTSMTGRTFPAGRGALNDRRVRRIVEQAAAVLEFDTGAGLPLNKAIPQQIYEDVFIRLLSALPGCAVSVRHPHPYAAFNALGHRLALALIDAMEASGLPAEPTADFPRLMRIAVLSGYVGINLKRSASAASDLLNRNLVPIDPAWVQSMAAVRTVPRENLLAIARKVIDLASGKEGDFALACLDQYHREVVNTDRPTLLLFFSDDYLESLIDMKRLAVVLDHNPNLKLLFVPRSGRYGNDLAVFDLPAVLAEKPFTGFRALQEEGRIAISPNGPRAGCIDPRYVSGALVDEIDALGAGRRIILETKGCRNFEMLQGRLPVPWYASFNCNRALSIRTVGVDGPPVFLRIPPGLKAYDGFMTPRIGRSPSYGTTGVRFARMTTRQLYAVLSGDIYRRMLRRSTDEYKLNRRLTQYCESAARTLPEVIAGGRGKPMDVEE